MDPATTEIYTLSLHDALPISPYRSLFMNRTLLLAGALAASMIVGCNNQKKDDQMADRKSTRLNSSHGYISYAVFCLKKKTRRHSLHATGLSHHHTGSHSPAPR